VFCDLVGSTALSQRLDPEDFREVLRAYRAGVIEAVTGFDGYVARFLGDGVLCYFGYPEAHEDDPERAVRAGLAILEAMETLKAPLDYLPRVRVGIETGLVVVAKEQLNSEQTEDDVAGETPNLAARLQTFAEPNAVVIGANTKRLVGDLFSCRYLGEREAKGFERPVPAWRVIDANFAISRFAARHETRLPPLIGREEEQGALRRAWRLACEGQGQVVVIAGEAGIGKSRLAEALHKEILPEGHVLVAYYCSPYHRESPFHPIVRQLERAAGFGRTDPPELRLRKLRATLLPPDENTEDLALLADLLSVPPPPGVPPLPTLPAKRKEKTGEALVHQLALLAERRPVYVLCEDVHWIDPSSEEVMRRLVAQVAGLRVLFVLTARPEAAPAWPASAHATLIDLAPLSTAECRELVAAVLGDRVLAPVVVDEIIDRTDGMPLYVEELTKAVLEASREGAAGREFVGRVPRSERGVPAALHASLMSRLDGLGRAREILQIGAAIGRVVPIDLLAAVSGLAEAPLEQTLAVAAASGLIERDAEDSHGSFRFRHALVQDAAYGTLLRDARQRLHRRIAETLETAFPEIPRAQPEVLAHHCTEGRLTVKAVDCWLRAGVQRLMRSAMQEALTLLRRGLGLLSELPEGDARDRRELDLQIALGKALIATRGYAVPETGAAFARARELCERLEEQPQLVAVLHGQYTHALMRAELERARVIGTGLVSKGEARGNEVSLVSGCRFVGVTSVALADFAGARRFLERGLALLPPEKRPLYAGLTVDDARVVMLTYLGYACLFLGLLDSARASIESAVTEAKDLNQPYSLAHALVGRTVFEYGTGSAEGVLQRANELAKLCEEQGIAFYGATAMIFRGWALAATGSTREGLELLGKAIAGYRATGSVLYLPMYFGICADAHLRAGDLAPAAELLEEVERVAEATRGLSSAVEMHLIRGRLQVLAGDHHGADASVDRALRVAQEQGTRLWALRARMIQLEIARDRRAPVDPVLHELRDALASIEGGADTRVVRDARRLCEAVPA
jgi:class 3 adenylate cyclase/tetratricopeptide (TPR) repeat protein